MMQGFKEELRGLVTKERSFRLTAFMIDFLVLSMLLSLCNLAIHKPDFVYVRQEMDKITQITDFEERQAQTQTAVNAFHEAYRLAIGIWLGYEIVTQLVFQGQTVGKKLCGLRVVSFQPGESRSKTAVRLTCRSLVKALFLILFQGFPIFISWFYILGNSANRAGYDLFVKTKVVSCRS